MSESTDLQRYVNSLLVDHVMREYESQISKWDSAYDNFALAYFNATQAHKRVLKNVNERRRLEHDRMMAILSFVCVVPATAWIGALVKTKVVPELISRTVSTTKVMEVNTILKAVTTTSKEYNKVFASVAGKMASETAGLGLSALEPDYYSAIKKPSIKSLEEFKTSLGTTFRDQCNLHMNHLADIALEILRSDNFGTDLLSEARAADLVPRYTSVRQAGDLYVQKLRKKLAADWFFFGNNPTFPSITVMQQIFEREFWAAWILVQGFKVLRWRPAGESDSGPRSVKGTQYQIKPEFPVEVSRKLVNLCVIGNKCRLEGPEKQRVYGRVDWERELKAVKQWAKNHPKTSVTGHRPQSKRIIGPLETMHRPQ